MKKWHYVLAALIIMVLLFGLAPQEAMNLISEVIIWLGETL